jgi:hypothetical protein
LENGLKVIKDRYKPLDVDLFLNGTIDFLDDFDACKNVVKALPDYGLLVLPVLKEVC